MIASGSPARAVVLALTRRGTTGNVSNKNRMLFRTNQYLRKNGLRDPVWKKISTNRH
jgi:hypothetical protein